MNNVGLWIKIFLYTLQIGYYLRAVTIPFKIDWLARFLQAYLKSRMKRKNVSVSSYIVDKFTTVRYAVAHAAGCNEGWQFVHMARPFRNERRSNL